MIGALRLSRWIPSACVFAISLAVTGAVQTPAGPVPPPCPAPDTAGLLVRFFDVGQGDAALLTTGDGRHVLVDGGPNATRVLQYLTALDVRRLDLMVASHHHLDHIGGLPAVLDAIPVANVVENGVPATTQVYARLIAALERSDARVLAAEARELGVGALRIRVIPPWVRSRGQNLSTVGLVATFGEFRILFTGDAETRGIGAWTSQGLVPAVTVIKVAHHGSRNGTTDELVRVAEAKLAVISVGARNSYGHPDAGVVARWTRAGARVMRTDEHGTVAIRGCADGSFSVATASARLPAGKE